MQPRSSRRVAVCRRASGDVTIIATVPSATPAAPPLQSPAASPSSAGPSPAPSYPSVWPNPARCEAADISPTGRVHPRPLTDPTGVATGRTPLAAALAECGPFAAVEEYAAYFGHVLLDKLYLLVATKVEVAVKLPFDRVIYNVKGTQWIGVALPGVPPPAATRKDRFRVEHFVNTQFDEGYFFSDECNTSTLFPHLPPGGKPISAFDPCYCDWSVVMRRAYDEAGCGRLCSSLVRGFASGLAFAGTTPASGASPQTVFCHMLGRQNRLNPGPRYYGRGLNENGQAGNDHVYELVMWHGAAAVPVETVDERHRRGDNPHQRRRLQRRPRVHRPAERAARGASRVLERGQAAVPQPVAGAELGGRGPSHRPLPCRRAARQRPRHEPRKQARSHARRPRCERRRRKRDGHYCN